MVPSAPMILRAWFPKQDDYTIPFIGLAMFLFCTAQACSTQWSKSLLYKQPLSPLRQNRSDHELLLHQPLLHPNQGLEAQGWDRHSGGWGIFLITALIRINAFPRLLVDQSKWLETLAFLKIKAWASSTRSRLTEAAWWRRPSKASIWDFEPDLIWPFWTNLLPDLVLTFVDLPVLQPCLHQHRHPLLLLLNLVNEIPKHFFVPTLVLPIDLPTHLRENTFRKHRDAIDILFIDASRTVVDVSLGVEDSIHVGPRCRILACRNSQRWCGRGSHAASPTRLHRCCLQQP